MDTTPSEAAQAVALLQAGLGQREVARQLNLTRSSVQRVFQRFQATGAFSRRPGTGRVRSTSEQDDRFIVVNSLRNRRLNAVHLQQKLRETRNVSISRWTVRRRLAEKNLTSHKAANGPKLTPSHRQARLRFAQEHENWTLEQWRTVLFSDECRICLFGNDGRERVYRRPGERFSQCCIEERVAYGGGSCMVWAGISLEAKTDIVFVTGPGVGPNSRGLTAHRYIEEVLAEHVVPFAGYIGDNFMLMQDNARPHTARITQEYLREVNIPAMDWPARSPDLNPIEHVWDELKRRIRARHPTPETLHQLKTAIEEEWAGIPQDFHHKLIRSMKNRMRACRLARGGNTRY